MNNNSQQKLYYPKNEIRLVGFLSDLQIDDLPRDQNGNLGLRVKKARFHNDDGVFLSLSGTRIPQFSKSGQLRGDYVSLQNARNLKRFELEGREGADLVTVTGEYNENIYVNQGGQLICREAIRVRNIYKASSDTPHAADLSIEGFIQTINPTEDGGLEVRIITPKFGSAVPVRFKVRPDLAGDFEGAFMPQQTGIFNLVFTTRIEQTAPTGGIGVQRTKGKKRTELVCLGTEGGAIPEGHEAYISPEYAAELLSKREARIQEMQAAGYMGSRTANIGIKTPSPVSAPAVSTSSSDLDDWGDDELPF